MDVQQYIKEYLGHYKNYKDYWNYEDGCVLLGSWNLYEATGDKEYVDFVKDYLKDWIGEDGAIRNYEDRTYNIDSINTGKILFGVYEETGEEKYKKALDYLMDRLSKHPRNEAGSFWHKEIYPNQVWLDGLYMALPFYMEYDTRFGGRERYGDILWQFENARKYMFSEEKGLYYHGYDHSRKQPWADPETGVSKNFWLRSMGWYIMALADTMAAMDIQIFEVYKRLEELFKEAIRGILAYEDPETKLFYQVIDKADEKGNYTETSGSAMVAYGVLKGVRIGALSREKYLPVGQEIFDGLVREKLVEENGMGRLVDICCVAGLGPGETRDGSVEYYLSEKIVSDDSKGVGPFMMACAQGLILEREEMALSLERRNGV